MEERGRDPGRLDTLFDVFVLRKPRIELDLSRAEFTRTEVAANVSSLTAREIVILKLEQFV